MKEGKLMEALPDEIWLKILEIGIEKSILGCSDICSFSVSCKHFDKLSNDNLLWVILLTLDFPECQNSGLSASSSKKMKTLYKYRLERYINRKIAFVERRLEKYELRLQRLEARIELNQRGIRDFDEQIEEIAGEFLELMRTRNLLQLDLLVETAKSSVRDAKTKFAEVEAWLSGIALNGQASPAASGDPSTSVPSTGVIIDSSSADSLDLQSKLRRVQSLHQGFCSAVQYDHTQISALHRRLQERAKQKAAFLKRLLSLVSCYDPADTDDYILYVDEDVEDSEEDTDDDYDSDDSDDDDDTEDDYDSDDDSEDEDEDGIDAHVNEDDDGDGDGDAEATEEEDDAYADND